MLTAIVLGATGLVGSQLLKLLLDDERFLKVVVLSRRKLDVYHPKLEVHVINFDKPQDWAHLVAGDVLFSAFGTTLSKAGSKDAQYKVDHTYQYQVAKAAADNGVKVYVLVSSAGADEKSMIFYSRMKGELERDIKKLPFKSIQIIQPGILDGNRNEERTAEKISISAMRLLGKIPGLRKYRPIKDKQVAMAMINAALKPHGKNTYALGKVFRLAKNKDV